jgi:hypothetical protein
MDHSHNGPENIDIFIFASEIHFSSGVDPDPAGSEIICNLDPNP